MKILIVNYRYFVSGGPERYMFNVKALLESHGHEVIPFSITYDRNEPSEYADYFAPPLGEASEVYFQDQSRSVGTYLRTIERAFYSRDVYRRLEALIRATRPDVALVQHYLRKLSPSVLKALADNDVPFVVRLSDFAMVCPNAHLVRDAKPCELCVTGGLRHSVQYRCVQGSLAASAVNYAATRFHQAARLFELIDQFVVPSRFTMSKMIEGGWEPSRMTHIPTFVTPYAGETESSGPAPATVTYVGRLDQLKGVHVLLEAVRMVRDAGRAESGFRVRVLGTGEEPYVSELRELVSRHALENVTFEGARSRAEVADALRGSVCSVVPSIWYENMPNSALESMAEGTPVIATAHGCFPEIIEHGKTGWLVPPEDSPALADALTAVLESPETAQAAGRRAAQFVAEEHAPERHYRLLMETFKVVGA